MLLSWNSLRIGLNQELLKEGEAAAVELYEWVKNWIGTHSSYQPVWELFDLMFYQDSRFTHDRETYLQEIDTLMNSLCLYVINTKSFDISQSLVFLIKRLSLVPKEQFLYFERWYLSFQKCVIDISNKDAIINHLGLLKKLSMQKWPQHQSLPTVELHFTSLVPGSLPSTKHNYNHNRQELLPLFT